MAGTRSERQGHWLTLEPAASSTTLFLALHKYLAEQRMRKGDRVMLLALASGIEIGIAVFTIDNLADSYGRAH